MLLKVAVRYGEVVFGGKVAKLKVVGGYKGNAPRAGELANGLSCADNAVSGICSLENFVNAQEKWLLLAAGFHHALDTEKLCVEGGKPLCDIVIDTDGSMDMEQCQGKFTGTDGSTGIGEENGAGKRPHVGGLA